MPVTGDISHGRILKIAVPVMLSNTLVPLLGAVDVAMAGWLGAAAAIGGLGIGATILGFLYWLFGFLRMGVTGLTAQAIGRGDHHESAALLLRGLMIAGAAGLLIVALRGPLFAAALRFFPASPEALEYASDYLYIRVFSAPALIATYALSGWLLARERPQAFFAMLFAMALTNAGLDVLFVVGLGWGVKGIAWATFVAEIAGCALGLWFCRDAFLAKVSRDRALIFNRKRIYDMMAVNGDIMLRSMLLEASFALFVALGARQGDLVLAANQILFQMFLIAGFALDGFAFAAEILVGRALGARQRAVLRRAVLRTSIWAVVLALLFSLILLLSGRFVVSLMTDLEEVRIEAMRFLIWAAFLPLIGIGAFMLDGVFIGATRTRDMRNAMLLSCGIYLAACVLLLPLFGNHGLWAGLWVLMLVRALLLGLRYPALEASASSA